MKSLRPEQIRVGNICLNELGKVFKVEPRHLGFTWGIKPIPIDDKYLSYLGFSKLISTEHRWETEDGVCYENGRIGIHNDLFTEVQFVHEIQNYYFGVMKKDFKIN